MCILRMMKCSIFDMIFPYVFQTSYSFPKKSYQISNILSFWKKSLHIIDELKTVLDFLNLLKQTLVHQESPDIIFILHSYIAVGLANEHEMGSASVMFCYTFNSNKTGAAMSWNVGYQNSIILGKVPVF